MTLTRSAAVTAVSARACGGGAQQPAGPRLRRAARLPRPAACQRTPGHPLASRAAPQRRLSGFASAASPRCAPQPSHGHPLAESRSDGRTRARQRSAAGPGCTPSRQRRAHGADAASLLRVSLGEMVSRWSRRSWQGRTALSAACGTRRGCPVKGGPRMPETKRGEAAHKRLGGSRRARRPAQPVPEQAGGSSGVTQRGRMCKRKNVQYALFGSARRLRRDSSSMCEPAGGTLGKGAACHLHSPPSFTSTPALPRHLRSLREPPSLTSAGPHIPVRPPVAGSSPHPSPRGPAGPACRALIPKRAPSGEGRAGWSTGSADFGHAVQDKEKIRVNAK